MIGNMLYIVGYQGPFGFIKPWTAVRDGETFSQQFLTPSIIEGMEKKLFPELLGLSGIRHIRRHRLSYEGMPAQQEQVQSRERKFKRDSKSGQWHLEVGTGVLTRHVLLNPVLWLAFDQEALARRALDQHLCLCRNEDLIFPIQTEPIFIQEADFDDPERFPGFELLFDAAGGLLAGYNRFTSPSEPMYGRLHVVGEPVRRTVIEMS